jgi:hypothetical protein
MWRPKQMAASHTRVSAVAAEASAAVPAIVTLTGNGSSAVYLQKYSSTYCRALELYRRWSALLQLANCPAVVTNQRDEFSAA